MTYAQAVTADANDPTVKKQLNNYNKYISTRNQGDMSQVVRPNPYVSYDPGVEAKVLKHIDSIDSEISGKQEEIGKLLNL